ncbi:orotidine-5'-phosphate decarboxylase [Alkalibaculum sp. M08DMB]|uniref:Orotidine 5'-phosphate decarboxylase n=1 Tax=Alkalibaculum sporogenes TaxID=2655001 RepID=A0A6A7KCG3_9FIRM|nr:orotidine-5'-phosphate decarboxylase [Alkalibaculum sporogenes]MPW26867.1 orotidine-5'-phosphate decarboxylase [Alkalibaculum sporogenes]
MIIDKLYQEAIDISPICLGLDTQESYLPDFMQNQDRSIGDKILQFNKDIIDHTADIVACYKVQIAYYEALGIEGLKAYSKTLEYIRGKKKISIGDIKRGDISATGQMYAKGHFEGDFEADIVTINAYMGEDAVSPFYPYIKDKNKGLFILLKTSNPSAKETQDISCEGVEYYKYMAKLIEKWGEDYIGKNDFSSIGAVVGLTYPKEFQIIQDMLPNTFFLVPGYGAQGGTGEDMGKILNKSRCAVINSSRGLITAHKGVNEGNYYYDEIRDATKRMKEDLAHWLK